MGGGGITGERMNQRVWIKKKRRKKSQDKQKDKTKRLDDKMKDREKALQCITANGFTLNCINAGTLGRLQHI